MANTFLSSAFHFYQYNIHTPCGGQLMKQSMVQVMRFQPMQCTCAPKPHLSLKIAASKSWTPQKTEVKQDLEDASCLHVSFLYHFCIISVSFLYLFLILLLLSPCWGSLFQHRPCGASAENPRRAKIWFFWGSVAGLIGNSGSVYPKLGVVSYWVGSCCRVKITIFNGKIKYFYGHFNYAVRYTVASTWCVKWSG